MYKRFVKRFIDIILSLIGLIALLPVFAIVGVLIYADDPGPVFFRQRRMGRDKKPFWLYKFRSMKLNTPEIPGYLMDNVDSYITAVGHIIRKTSIDELPQLLNVLFGNMSLVGYRPSLYENEDELIEERDKYSIYRCKPGITGWAQINGRDEIAVQTKVQYDSVYVETMENGGFKAFIMDIKCLLITVVKVLKRDNVIEGVIIQDDRKEVAYK